MDFTKNSGLGDTVKTITDFTGITKVVNIITGGNCNCDKRQEWLNQKIPYNKK
jgi:hypothetical protein